MSPLLARQTYADNVYIALCGPEQDVVIGDQTQTVQGYHTWQNDNPGSPTGQTHAYIRAQPTVNGSPVTFNLEPQSQYQRQVNDTTYEMFVGPDGAQATAIFHMHQAQLPEGANVPYDRNVLAIENRALGDW